MASIDKPCSCACGKDPQVKEVFGFGYIVKCDCGDESWTKLNRSVAIANWNMNRQGEK